MHFYTRSLKKNENRAIIVRLLFTLWADFMNYPGSQDRGRGLTFLEGADRIYFWDFEDINIKVDRYTLYNYEINFSLFLILR